MDEEEKKSKEDIEINKFFGKTNPMDDIYNALLGVGDIDLIGKYAVLGAIHDSFDESEHQLISPRSKDFTRAIRKIVDDAGKAKPRVAMNIINKWLSEIEEDLKNRGLLQNSPRGQRCK